MTLFHFFEHHLWEFVAVAALVGALSLVFRRRVARLVRLAKAAATDPRLPRPVRWIFRIGIAAKLFPGPDLGIDEVALGLGIVLLLGPYRHIWREIREGIE